MALSLRDWTFLGVSRILGEDMANDVVDYLIQLSPSEVTSYCESMLGDAPDAKAFTKELVRRLERAFSAASGEAESTTSAAGPVSTPSTAPSAQAQSSQPASAQNRNAPASRDGANAPADGSAQGGSRGAGRQGQAEGQGQLPQGSREAPRPVVDIGPPAPSSCSCFARSHPLLGNCLWCGRVLCVEHGWTRCTCGAALPAHVLVAGGNKLRQVPADGGATVAAAAPQAELTNAAASEAIARKERLLQYDRTSASRTKVLDDDSDYFSTLHSSWASKEEKEAAMAAAKAAKEKEERDKRGLKISLDFAGRAVVVRAERAEAEAASQARLLAIARGELHGAHGAIASSEESHAGRVVPPSTIEGEDAHAAHAAAAGAHLTAARQAAGVGSGAFANHTLTGRAAEIYEAIVSGMVKKGRATVQVGGHAQEGRGGGGRKLQHEELAAAIGT